MRTARKKSEYWGRPTNAPSHPYVEFEGTQLWRTVKKALSDLEKNQDVELREWHQYVVGYVCRQLSRAELVTRSAKNKGRTGCAEPRDDPSVACWKTVARGRSAGLLGGDLQPALVLELESQTQTKPKTKGNWMKRTAGLLSLVSIAVLLGASGCSTLHKSDSATLQGKWGGREIGATPEAPRQLVFSGKQVDYRGANPDDWGRGTFTLREDTQPKQLLVTLTECGPAQYIGKTCCMIYKIEDGILTAAANEPGNPAAPLSFEAPGARHMVFKKE